MHTFFLFTCSGVSGKYATFCYDGIEFFFICIHIYIKFYFYRMCIQNFLLNFWIWLLKASLCLVPIKVRSLMSNYRLIFSSCIFQICVCFRNLTESSQSPLYLAKKFRWICSFGIILHKTKWSNHINKSTWQIA